MPSLRDRLTGAARLAAQTGRLMVGVPDYDTYVTHRAQCHPGEPVMTLPEFHRNRIDRRYGDGPDRVPRCC